MPRSTPPRSKQEKHSVYSNPRYYGKHVVTVDGKVFVATTGDEAMRLLAQVRKNILIKTNPGIYPQRGNTHFDEWTTIRLIVDTRADHTLLPRSYAKVLNVSLEKEEPPAVELPAEGRQMPLEWSAQPTGDCRPS